MEHDSLTSYRLAHPEESIQNRSDNQLRIQKALYLEALEEALSHTAYNALIDLIAIERELTLRENE